MNKDVIIACDFSSKEETLTFLEQFKEEKPYIKIGMELFYAEGSEIVKVIKNRGHKVFLDLKLCDIPNTVYKSMKNISSLNVDMTNVHASGGIEMMKAAKKAISESNYETKLLAVTVLTSISENTLNNELLINNNLKDVVAKYTENAFKANLDGVVCSPLEASNVFETYGDKFYSVTPGIRFSDSVNDDQKRKTTPQKAAELGSTYIVVGRPITNAKDPVEAYRICLKQFMGEQ